MDSFETRETRVLRLFFHITAVVTDCDFMQTSLIVFVVYWYFASLRILLQSHCNFADQYVNFADTRWCVIVDFFSFFLPGKLDFVPFNDLLPNWY